MCCDFDFVAAMCQFTYLKHSQHIIGIHGFNCWAVRVTSSVVDERETPIYDGHLIKTIYFLVQIVEGPRLNNEENCLRCVFFIGVREQSANIGVSFSFLQL